MYSTYKTNTLWCHTENEKREKCVASFSFLILFAIEGCITVSIIYLRIDICNIYMHSYIYDTKYHIQNTSII